MGLHTTQVFCPPAPIHPPSSAYTMNLVLWEGLSEASEAAPSPPGPSTIKLRAGSSGLSLHVRLLALRLQGTSEQEGAWGLMHLCWGGRCGGLGGVTWLWDTEWRGLEEDKLN